MNTWCTEGNARQILQALKADTEAYGYFRRCHERIAVMRTVFTLDNGYAGSGPLGIMRGDTIALVAGVPVPLVLREVCECSKRYSVAGPALFRE